MKPINPKNYGHLVVLVLKEGLDPISQAAILIDCLLTTADGWTRVVRIYKAADNNYPNDLGSLLTLREALYDISEVAYHSHIEEWDKLVEEDRKLNG